MGFLCLCVWLSVGEQVNISGLSSREAHEVAFVISSDASLSKMVSYSGYIAVDDSITQSHDVNYFFWFFEALQSSSPCVHGAIA